MEGLLNAEEGENRGLLGPIDSEELVAKHDHSNIFQIAWSQENAHVGVSQAHRRIWSMQSEVCR